MKKKLHKILKNLRFESEIYRYIIYVTVSIIVGIFAGFGAVLFHYLLDNMRILFEEGIFFKRFSIDTRLIILVPVVGAVVTATMTKLFPNVAKEKGVASVIKSLLMNNGYIPIKETVFHLFAPIISIGTGAPLGPEGPAAKIGSGIASFLCQALRLPHKDMKMHTASGAGAAISAVFNAPIAGVFFGIEVILLNDIKNKHLSGFIISSVVANLVSKALLGNRPVFQIPYYRYPEISDYPFFLLLGIICGIISLLYFLFSRLSGYVINERLKIKNEYLSVMAVSFLFGLVLIDFSGLFGIGYDTINRVINSQFTLNAAIAMLVLKVFFVALFLRAGAYGGIFAPALGMGVLTGYAFSGVINSVFNVNTDPVIFSLIGMGGVLAGINSIPLTSMMLVFELTDDYRIILPLMFVSVISYLAVIFVNKGSVYSLELHEQGINAAMYSDYNLLSKIKVSDLMRNDYEAVDKAMPFRKLIPFMIDSKCNDIFVVNNKNHLEGIIPIKDIKHILVSSDLVDFLIAMDISSPAPMLTGSETVSAAIQRIEEYDIENIPIVKSYNSKEIVGMITRHDILKAYNRLLESGEKINL